ncbi:hypothetical protein FCH28_03535 [Streptomyces piniterrae]|uniref:PASTA domain-containing protein n=1 Tax=Streptomyces piniterrae TaxID=2571125 RepID=A0A4U0NWN0_9ACTN|nr:hypothetical protein [Streptomyces piniterrae]TJZ59181.1 hypothetical protein FCH28_03535 [Streptomyces piniterrae]
MLRTIAVTALAASVAACCLGLAACEPAASPSADGASGRETAALPDLVGKGLQTAQDKAQSAGFHRLGSHDARGRGRMQAFDRNWKVCTQKPGPGRRDTNITVEFGAVKVEESCPGKDAGTQAPPKAGSVMPDLRGKSVKVARKAMDFNTSIAVKDATGQRRFIVMESNWRVCSQSPAAGTKYDGQPVAFQAVKFGEKCD